MKRIALTLLVALAAMASVAAQANGFIRSGATLYWTASSGDNGTMKVGVVSGQYFEVEQSNDKNRAAGAQKLYGAILDNGRKIVLLNVGNWKEVWEGSVSANGVKGNIVAGSSSFSFTITTQATARPGNQPSQGAAFPFAPGKVLRWKSSHGQNGTMTVTSVNGNRFTLDQKNALNTAAGVTRLSGEIKNGQIFIYNSQWNETWVGTYQNGIITGAINDTYQFTISE